MGSFGRSFAILVIVLDIFAIVFFAGNYITTGSVLSSHGHHEDTKLAALLPAEETAATEATQTAAAVPAGPIVGDATRGAATVGKCKACHTFDKGGKNMIGPNLYGIFGNHIMHLDGFAYSTAFQDKKGLVWNEENLAKFLENPKGLVPGTKMAFPGLKNPQDRADVLAYLKTLK